MGSIFGLISPTGNVVYQWGRADRAASYYNLYFEPRIQRTDVFWIGLRKNCGIFVEGTMYGYILDIAYMLQRMAEKKRPKVSFLLMLTIITTFSIAPILAILIFEGFNMVVHKMKNRQFNIIKHFFIPVIAAVCIAVFFEILQEKSLTGSYNVRFDHMIGCFRVFIDTFPFGIGYGNSDMLIRKFRYAQGLSVGIPFMLALEGWWCISVDNISSLEICGAFSS